MSTRLSKTLAALVVSGAVALLAPAFALAGASYTTVNTSFDHDGHCLNGNGNVNCNIYDGKQYVWINGGPDGNKLTDGYWFFAVLAPSGQNNPNDGGAGNLSDDWDTYQNRMFRVQGGEITSYTGTHLYDVDENDNNENKIRLYKYSDTPNNGGVYILALCSLGTNGTSYPVNPRNCKYDAFKIPTNDTTPPSCPTPVFGYNRDGQKTATAQFSDPGGIDTITVDEITNATYTFSSFYQGTTDPVTLTATKIDQTKKATVRVIVTDVGGNRSVCDPVLSSLRMGRRAARTSTFRHLSRHERFLTVQNGRPGVRAITVSANGHRMVLRLRSGERRRVSIASLLRHGRHNTVRVHGYGARGATADIVISN